MLVAGCADSPEDVCHLGARRVLDRDDTELGRREDMEGGGRVSKRGCCLWASLRPPVFPIRQQCVMLLALNCGGDPNRYVTATELRKRSAAAALPVTLSCKH